MEGGKEQNFWPGFVDALSNVVLVMIFVVVVFVVTLFYYSQKLAQMKVSKLITQSQTQAVQGEVKNRKSEVSGSADNSGSAIPGSNDPADSKSEREKTQEIEQLKREVASLKAKLASAPLQSDNGSLRSAAAPSSPNAIQVKAEPNDKEVAPGLRIDANEKAVTLNFDVDSTQLSEEGGRAHRLLLRTINYVGQMNPYKNEASAKAAREYGVVQHRAWITGRHSGLIRRHAAALHNVAHLCQSAGAAYDPALL